MVLTRNNVLERIQASAKTAYSGGLLELHFQAMATKCRIVCACDPRTAQAFAGSIIRWISEFEARYSRFLPESLVSQINRAAGREPIAIDPETHHLLNLCHELHFITRGILDPTALPLLRIWDWKNQVIPNEEQIAGALAKVGWRKVHRTADRIFLPDPGMGIDLGGVGKEYAVDRAVQIALEHGIQSVLVDFGQDVRVQGTPTGNKPFWHVGLENAENPGNCWAGIGLREGAVATSGDYVRHFERNGRRYGHIIDPRTGYPVSNGSLAVSVLAPSCTLAGALSTAAFVLGPKDGVNLIDAVPQAEGCIITGTGKHPSRRFYEYVASERK